VNKIEMIGIVFLICLAGYQVLRLEDSLISRLYGEWRMRSLERLRNIIGNGKKGV